MAFNASHRNSIYFADNAEMTSCEALTSAFSSSWKFDNFVCKSNCEVSKLLETKYNFLEELNSACVAVAAGDTLESFGAHEMTKGSIDDMDICKVIEKVFISKFGQNNLPNSDSIEYLRLLERIATERTSYPEAFKSDINLLPPFQQGISHGYTKPILYKLSTENNIRQWVNDNIKQKIKKETINIILKEIERVQLKLFGKSSKECDLIWYFTISTPWIALKSDSKCDLNCYVLAKDYITKPNWSQWENGFKNISSIQKTSNYYLRDNLICNCQMSKGRAVSNEKICVFELTTNGELLTAKMTQLEANVFRNLWLSWDLNRFARNTDIRKFISTESLNVIAFAGLGIALDYSFDYYKKLMREVRCCLVDGKNKYVDEKDDENEELIRKYPALFALMRQGRFLYFVVRTVRYEIAELRTEIQKCAKQGDIAKLAITTKADIANLAATTKADIANLAATTKADIANLAATTKTDIATLAATTKADFTKLDENVNKILSFLKGNQM
ncbi:unnamed protein product [Rotaria socialis]|uniref:Uncharacterized protein n=1 Tax=Rotaria socialis TaxID=392032 RepID=A0A818VR85_9BILA|nr:unnamed protein product [Rotaria socialis]CAF4898170.1 unnamed protein product [Rotaria socialis]